MKMTVYEKQVHGNVWCWIRSCIHV